MTQPFIGARLENIELSSFVNYGIPIPAYSMSVGLLLLFNNQLECKNYVDLLKAISNEMQTIDPERIKEHIQSALVFIALLVAQL